MPYEFSITFGLPFLPSPCIIPNAVAASLFQSFIAYQQSASKERMA